MLERANKNKEDAKADNVSFVDSQITAINLPDSVADCIISNCVVNLVPESDKQLVFNEMFRLLKPGGRVAISDILAKKPLPSKIRESVALYVGCIAGASQVGDYEKYLRKAGFNGTHPSLDQAIYPTFIFYVFLITCIEILIVDTKSDLNVYTTAKEVGQNNGGCGTQSKPGCCSGGIPSRGLESDVENVDFNEWAGMLQTIFLSVHRQLTGVTGSFKIYAIKT